jgi:Putative phage metallopeptidase
VFAQAFAKLKRPYPPEALLRPATEGVFVPDLVAAEWLLDTFVYEGTPLHNSDHTHLRMATIGVLWTNVRNIRQMLPVVGTAELTRPKPMQSAWEKARWQYQLRQWFDAEVPNFLITLYAPYVGTCEHATFCAICEHELYHCRLKEVTRRGVPIWGIYGHDVEEHVGVVARYGVGAAAGKTRELVAAAKRKPLIAPAHIAGVCGTEKCLKLAA